MLRLHTFAALVVTIAFPTANWCQQTDPKQEQQSVHGSQGGQSVPASENQSKTIVVEGSPNATLAPQHDSIAAAARKSREQKRESPKGQPKIFTNENIPTSGGISSIGGESPAKGSADKASGGAASGSNEEKAWRERFSRLNHKVEQDKQELEVMQRELGVLNVQYYNDPVKAMQQQLTRSDINDKTAKIDEKKKQIDADQQAIADAQEELRKTGGDPGWAR